MKTYNYYKCLSNKRKRGCEQKKAIKKDWIEQLVVQDTVDYVLQGKEIQRIAKMLMALQEREDTALPLLRNELEDTEKGLKNIADALQQGIITNTTKQRLEELGSLKSDIEIKILQTALQKSILAEEKIVFWINRFKGSYITDITYQRAIIDIFVNAIYIYDDKIVLTYNFKSDARTISLTEIEISDLPQSAPFCAADCESVLGFTLTIGISQAAINRYEHDQAMVPHGALLKYAEFFDVSADYILGRTDKPEGMLFKHEPELLNRKMVRDDEWGDFVEACFDPRSPMN